LALPELVEEPVEPHALLLDLRLQVVGVGEIHAHGLDRLEAAVDEVGDHAPARRLLRLAPRVVLRRRGLLPEPAELREPQPDLRLVPREALVEDPAAALELGEHALELGHAPLVEALLLREKLHQLAQGPDPLLRAALVLERLDDLPLLLVDLPPE